MFRPFGHGEESSHRGFEFLTQSPVKGKPIPPHPDPHPKLLRSYSSSALMAGVPGGSGGADAYRDFWDGSREHIPKMNFPPFDGENPKLWLGRCLDYFDMYVVPIRRWVKVATMHMTVAQVYLALSMNTSTEAASVHSIQFQGTVQGMPARILLDSGSSHTFVSTDLAARLSGLSSLSPALRVSMANGSVLSCSTKFKQLEWSVQDSTFVSEAKVLPLKLYDLILGMTGCQPIVRCTLIGIINGF
jgi:hypothetical protein